MTDPAAKRQTFLALGLMVLAVCTAWAQGEESTVLASAEGETVTLEDWQTHLAENPRMETYTHVSPERIERTVRSQIMGILTRRLNERDAAAMIDTERGRAALAIAERSALARWVSGARLAEGIEVTDAEIEESYDQDRDEFQQPDRLTFRHLYLDLTDVSEEEAEVKRALAREIVAQLREDPSRFPALVEEHSESEDRRPDLVLGPIGPEQIHEELSGPLWELEEGEISDPLESAFGLHIFQVVQRIRRERSLEEVRGVLENRILRERIQARVEALMASAEEEFGLTLAPVPERLEADTVILSGAETLTGAQLAEARGLDLEGFPTGSALESLITDVQRGAVLAALARQRGWDEEPEVQHRLASAREEVISRLAWEQRTEAEAPVTDEDVRAFYEEGREQFVDPVRCRVRTLELRPARHAQAGERFALRSVLEQAHHLREAWEAGEPFEDLVREHSTADDAAEGGEPRWVYPQGSDAAVYASIAELATGEVSEPLRLPDGYMLAEVLAVEHNHQQLFEDVAPRIRRYLERQRARRVQREWQERLEQEIEWGDLGPIIERHLVTPEAATPEAANPES